MSYKPLRDRYGVTVSTAPISFTKTGPDEWRSRDGAWRVTHIYKKGYQAHHEYHVYSPDGQLFNRRTHFTHYPTLADAVGCVNECVALGFVDFLRNLLRWNREHEATCETQRAKERLRAERVATVVELADQMGYHGTVAFANAVVARLFPEARS